LKGFLDSRPEWTLSETFKEEKEGIMFRMKFADWPEPGKIEALKERQSGTKNRKERRRKKKGKSSHLLLFFGFFLFSLNIF
jgi:hypothetical protein